MVLLAAQRFRAFPAEVTMSDDVVQETHLYSDDVRLVFDIIKEGWSIGLEEPLNIEFKPEEFMVNARIGNIYIYHSSRGNDINTVDYRTLKRESRLAVRVANRFREAHFKWCDEVYRILMANRRLGKPGLRGYTYLEVVDDRTFNDASGWYVTTFNVKLVSYNTPIRSAGFGDEINKAIDNCQSSDSMMRFISANGGHKP